MSKHYSEFVKYPTGKTKKGSFCDCCKKFNARYSTVDLIALKDDKILLAKRNHEPMRGYWSLIAGYVAWGETLEETATRELKEETNLEMDSAELVGVYSDPSRDPDGKQNIAHCFAAQVLGGDIKRQEDEITELRWFDLGNLPEKMAFDHKKMVEDYKRGLGD